jgi:uncharacterized protein (DUF433 family)
VDRLSWIKKEMTADQKNALANVIAVDKGIMHGAACFAGTRVPVQTLFDFLATGEGIDDFLAAFPYIPREQVHTFLELTKDIAVEQLTSASL